MDILTNTHLALNYVDGERVVLSQGSVMFELLLDSTHASKMPDHYFKY